MLVAFCAFSISTTTTQCFMRDIPPTISGNPYTDYVSSQFLPNINLRQETPISITEKPVAEVTLKTAEVSNYLINNGFADKATADKIQQRIKLTKTVSTSFNDFNCDDMSQNFNSLAKDQKNENNFWNKIISRSATLVKATRTNDTVQLKVKKVYGSMSKRWASIYSSTQTHMYWCTITDQDCGMKPVQEYKCETVTTQQYKCSSQPVSSYQCTGFGTTRSCGFKTSYQQKCGFQPVQQQKCGMKTVQKYKCETKTSQKMFTKPYQLFKVGFTDSFNATEVSDMFTSVQNQIKDRLHF